MYIHLQWVNQATCPTVLTLFSLPLSLCQVLRCTPPRSGSCGTNTTLSRPPSGRSAYCSMTCYWETSPSRRTHRLWPATSTSTCRSHQVGGLKFTTLFCIYMCVLRIHAREYCHVCGCCGCCGCVGFIATSVLPFVMLSVCVPLFDISLPLHGNLLNSAFPFHKSVY